MGSVSQKLGAANRYKASATASRKNTVEIVFTPQHPHISEICLCLSQTPALAAMRWSYGQRTRAKPLATVPGSWSRGRDDETCSSLICRD